MTRRARLLAGYKVLRWEDPPPQRNGRIRGVTGKTAVSEWAVAAQQLRDEPGRWAVIAVYPTVGTGADALASRIRRGQDPAFTPADTFDAVVRTIGTQRHVYARLVPS